MIPAICYNCKFTYMFPAIAGGTAKCPKCGCEDLRVAAFPDAAEIDRMVRSDREMMTGENDE
jgi:hypothetical protein